MGFLEAFVHGNASATDPAKVQQQLAPILLDDETVSRAFQFIRDQVVFTNRRLIFVNKQGVTGKKTEWQSIPYNRITSFSAETAGFLDTDAELRLWVQGHAMPIKIEISKGVPIQDICKVLAHYVLR